MLNSRFRADASTPSAAERRWVSPFRRQSSCRRGKTTRKRLAPASRPPTAFTMGLPFEFQRLRAHKRASRTPGLQSRVADQHGRPLAPDAHRRVTTNEA